jgi:RimJ/RimL family protein N-acetyltransferase
MHPPVGTPMKQPIVETKYCVLRPADVSDLDAVVAAVRSPSFPRRLPLVEMEAEGRLALWLQQMCSRSAEGSAFLWSIDLLEGTRCIGQITLSPKPESTAWGLAFWLNPAYWGRGLAVDAVSPVLGLAFEVLHIPELWAGVAHWNHRSIDTLKRLGLSFLRDNPTGYVVWGVSEPVHEFHLTQAQWRELCNA